MDYRDVFPDEKSKAEAFDKIAELYYRLNFGTVQKAEIDLLMFSLFLDKLYQKDGVTENDYSDYTLSKTLGITQGRIRTLKERKEIKYPSDYNWKHDFWHSLEKAEYKEEKIKLYIRDHRLYTELCNIANEIGSYSETTLTKNQVVLSPPVLVDIMIIASEDDSNDKEMREKLKEILEKNNFDFEKYLKGDISLAELLKEQSKTIVDGILTDIIKLIPIFGDSLGENIVGAKNEVIKWLENRKKD